MILGVICYVALKVGMILLGILEIMQKQVSGVGLIAIGSISPLGVILAMAGILTTGASFITYLIIAFAITAIASNYFQEKFTKSVVVPA